MEIIRNMKGRYEIRRPCHYGADHFEYWAKGSGYWWASYRSKATKFLTLWGAKREYNRLLVSNDTMVWPE